MNKLIIIFFLICFAGCSIHPVDLAPSPINPIIQSSRIEDPYIVYIPGYVPKSLYLYQGIWYDEPYTIITYSGKGSVKIPNRFIKFIKPKSRPLLRRMPANNIKRKIQKQKGLPQRFKPKQTITPNRTKEQISKKTTPSSNNQRANQQRARIRSRVRRKK